MVFVTESYLFSAGAVCRYKHIHTYTCSVRKTHESFYSGRWGMVRPRRCHGFPCVCLPAPSPFLSCLCLCLSPTFPLHIPFMYFCCCDEVKPRISLPLSYEPQILNRILLTQVGFNHLSSRNYRPDDYIWLVYSISQKNIHSC